MNRARIALIGILTPVGIWAALVGGTFGVAAINSRGSDVLVWLALGTASGLAVVIALLAATRFRTPTFWWSALIVAFCVLLTLPGTLLLEAFGRNPP